MYKLKENGGKKINPIVYQMDITPEGEKDKEVTQHRKTDLAEWFF